jgi:hypothetical protein
MALGSASAMALWAFKFIGENAFNID